MIIKSAKIEWMKGYGNLPELKVTVDQMPKMKDMKFKRLGEPRGYSYWAQDGDFVTFFFHAPGNQTGYGGSTFSGVLEDGSEFSVKGPWSSNAMDMNGEFPPSHNVAYYETDGKFPDLGFAAHITMAKAIELIDECGADWTFIKQYGGRRNEMEVTDEELIDNLTKKVAKGEVIGHYDIAIRLKGMTLEESQEAKNA